MKRPFISVVIPTYNSEKYITTCIKSILNQNYPGKLIEIFIVDNGSKDNTLKVAKKLGVNILLCKGKPPMVCKQRNMGAYKAKGDYLLFLDHDMELHSDLFSIFAAQLSKSKNKVTVWSIPEKILTSNPILGIVRNFEASFIDNTVVSAARLIKRSIFLKTPDNYDLRLSSGPADWDMDIQLHRMKCRFGLVHSFLYHHEEKLSLKGYIFKKRNYAKGGEIYKKKWLDADPLMYKKIIQKQYGLSYRLFAIFIERKKWKRLVRSLHKYILFILVKALMVVDYSVYSFTHILYEKK